jgi:predicted membrane channel-forming protein YqfA (hemolysin III family)
MNTIGIAIANMIKTDNKMVDSFLIMLVPMVISYIFACSNYINKIPEWYNYIVYRNYIKLHIDE